MNLTVLPLAITMMAGPQIISAVVLVTSKEAIRASLAFVAGVAIAATIGVTIARVIAGLVGGSIDLGDPSDASSGGNVTQYALVALLILGALKSFRERHEEKEPPKWLTALMTAGPAKAFKTGLLLIGVFLPTSS